MVERAKWVVLALVVGLVGVLVACGAVDDGAAVGGVDGIIGGREERVVPTAMPPQSPSQITVDEDICCTIAGDAALCSFALFWDPAWVTVAITDVYDMDALTETMDLLMPTYTLASEWRLTQGDALVATGMVENDLMPVVTTTMEFSATGQFDGAVPFIVPLAFGGTADLWVRARWVPEWCPTDRCPTVCTYVPGGVADADWWWFDELVGVMEPAGWTMYLPTVAKARE